MNLCDINHFMLAIYSVSSYYVVIKGYDMQKREPPTSYLYRLLSGLQYDAMPHESMVFCWTKLVAFQDKVALALFKKFSVKHWPPDWRPIEYFFRVLNDAERQADTRAMATFIVARACDVVVVNGERTMQDIIYEHSFKAEFDMLELLNERHHDALLRKWLLILVGRMWDDHDACYKKAERSNYIETVLEFAKTDPDPEVRAAAIYAIGTYIGCSPTHSTEAEPESQMCKPAILNNASEVAQLLNDACFVVRREIVYSLGLFLARYIAVMSQIRREFQKVQNRPGRDKYDARANQAGPIEPIDVVKESCWFTMHPTSKIAEAVARLAMDPQGEVQRPAEQLFDRIFNPNRLMGK